MSKYGREEGEKEQTNETDRNETNHFKSYLNTNIQNTPVKY